MFVVDEVTELRIEAVQLEGFLRTAYHLRVLHVVDVDGQQVDVLVGVQILAPDGNVYVTRNAPESQVFRVGRIRVVDHVDAFV